MIKFIKNISLFTAPVLVLLLFTEYYCRTQTTFGIKKKYLEANIDSVEVLILGSSHAQNGLNPNFIDAKTSNLAFGGQAISIDYYLLDKYIRKMHSLKTVIMDVSPFRFYDDHNTNNWNGHIYATLYNIDYKITSPSLKDYSLIAADSKFFPSPFINYINPFAIRYKLDRYGFITNDFHDRFEQLNYDSLKISASYKMQHDFTNKEDFKLNRMYLKKIIELCKNNNADILLLSTPVYKTYAAAIPETAKMEVKDMITEYKLLFGINYADYTEDPLFGIKDFKNDNHLNPAGAEKFTKMINTLLQKKKTNTGL